jgi:biopolymer transport protein ExbD
MRRRKRSLPEEGFQMAPMIDMVFLLLVFFMCVSSAANAEKSIPLDLPESKTSKVPEELTGRGMISVDAEGSIFVGETAVTSTQLKAMIRELVGRKPDTQVVVRADKTTRYEHIKNVLKDCAEAGAYEIIYATYESN